MRFLPILLLAACTTMPAEERELRAFNTKENYRLCVLAYDQAHVGMFHNNHTHRDGTSVIEMRQDLADNNCRMILKDYWID